MLAIALSRDQSLLYYLVIESGNLPLREVIVRIIINYTKQLQGELYMHHKDV